MKLPSDIDYYVFSKVANIYFKSHLWAMKREPIQTPFLSKSRDSDFQESLAIFKLILRFMNDTGLSGRREKVLGDYIVQKGLSNPKLRDEIYCQLANQTWKNENAENCERGWVLIANCLSAFGPSRFGHKFNFFPFNCAQLKLFWVHLKGSGRKEGGEVKVKERYAEALRVCTPSPNSQRLRCPWIIPNNGTAGA